MANSNLHNCTTATARNALYTKLKHREQTVPAMPQHVNLHMLDLVCRPKSN